MDDDSLVIKGLGDETLQRIQLQLDAEQNGIPLAEYFRQHSVVLATLEDLEEQEAKDRKSGLYRGNRLPGVGGINFVDEEKAVEIYYFDSRYSLRFIKLPFSQVTEFKNVADILNQTVKGETVIEILKNAGFKDINWSLYAGYRDRAIDIAKHKEEASTPQIDF